MARVLFISGVVAVAFVIYTIVDVLLTDKRRVRALNKPLWILLVVVVPVIGGLLWLAIGKARKGSGGDVRRVAPDDDPNFLSGLSAREDQDERIRRLEQELADLDDDPPNN